MNQKLTANLTIGEMIRSKTATKLRIDNRPSQRQIDNMNDWAKNIFQPARDWWGRPIHVTSGLRVPKLDKAVGGSGAGQHTKGEAGDLDTYDNSDNARIFDWIRANLEFDQMIWEYGDSEGPEWIHVSYTSDRPNRNQVLQIRVNAQGKKQTIDITNAEPQL